MRLVVSIEYTNVTDSQTDRQTDIHTAQRHKPRFNAQNPAANDAPLYPHRTLWRYTNAVLLLLLLL